MVIVMIGDSVTEPHIIAADSGLRVYVPEHMQNSAGSGDMLL